MEVPERCVVVVCQDLRSPAAQTHHVYDSTRPFSLLIRPDLPVGSLFEVACLS